MLTLLANTSYGATCVGVTWRSAQDDIDACLATKPCQGVTQNSPQNILEQCRAVLPCHGLTNDASKEEKKICRDMQLASGKSLYRSMGDTVYNVSDSGEININLPGEEGEPARTFNANSSMLGGKETTSSLFSAGETYDDESALTNSVRGDLGTLETQGTRRGNAYQTLMSIQNQNPPTPIGHNDPILTRTQDSVNAIDSGSSSAFGHCIETVEYYDQTFDFENAEQFTCSEMVSENFFSGECEVERKIEGPIRSIQTFGRFSFERCGPRCLRFNTPSIKDNDLNGGKCTIFPAGFSIETNEPLSITRATVDGSADDHAQLVVDGTVLFDSNPGVFNGTIEDCEKKANTEYFYNNVSYTSHFNSSITNDRRLDVTFNTGVGDGGEYDYTVELHFDKDVSSVAEIIRQKSPSCYDDLGPNYNTNGFKSETYCVAEQWKCLEYDNNLLGELAQDIPELFPGSTASCLVALSQNYRCDPLASAGFGDDDEVCFQDEVTDPDTGEILQEKLCYTAKEVKDVQNNACDDLLARPECQVSDRECMWEDTLTKKCFSWRYEYACTDPDQVTLTNARTSNICDSDIACAGGDCDVSEKETNTDFLNVAGQYSAVMGMSQDSNCQDPNDPSTCTIFPGEYEYCSFYPVGNDCCEGPSGVSPYDYVSVLSNMQTLDSQIMKSDMLSNTLVRDGWEAIREPVVSAYNTVSQSLTTAWNSIAGSSTGQAVTKAGQAVGEAISEGLSALKEEMTSYISDLMPDALKEMLFDQATDTAASAGTTTVMDGALSEAMNMVSGVMAVYSAYQMANLVITLATQCDDNEADAGLKIQMDQCIKVNNSINEDINDQGSTCAKKVLGVCLKRQHHYCCYSSPLARIIIEQAMPQLGKTITVDQETFTCQGLMIDEMKQLDWDKIDMSEWIGLMSGAGLVPTSSDDVNMDSMTGDGQLLNKYGRQTTVERLEDRTSGNELSDKQQEVFNSVDALNVDCSVPTPPPVCIYRSTGGN
ncbi:conjugal transfer protein TraN [Pseudoalteromonas sp. T1lg23B]|uniref:conjugal transfer protein TraN n=1 Tax=Pseudoalteromonas sp. T1lg23B TaxID=2077097 RepID=UPI001F37516E|nr:conjugal transfer protein TraN [Pseudoalteromonas sp. T1lg23B]